MTDLDKITWSHTGANILSADHLAVIERHLNEVGNIAVEHWHYYGSKSPTPLAFNDYEAFVHYLNTEVQPGDGIDVYAFPSNAESALVRAKYPDKEGRVPEGGAY